MHGVTPLPVGRFIKFITFFTEVIWHARYLVQKHSGSVTGFCVNIILHDNMCVTCYKKVAPKKSQNL